LYANAEVGAVCPVQLANSEIGDDRKTTLYFILEFKMADGRHIENSF